jgi:hypothetical protein
MPVCGSKFPYPLNYASGDPSQHAYHIASLFHTVSQVVLKPGRYRLLALKYRISKSQDLIDQNEREIAAQVSWFSFDDQDPVNTAASLVPQAFLTLVFEG